MGAAWHRVSKRQVMRWIGVVCTAVCWQPMSGESRMDGGATPMWGQQALHTEWCSCGTAWIECLSTALPGSGWVGGGLDVRAASPRHGDEPLSGKRGRVAEVAEVVPAVLWLPALG